MPRGGALRDSLALTTNVGPGRGGPAPCPRGHLLSQLKVQQQRPSDAVVGEEAAVRSHGSGNTRLSTSALHDRLATMCQQRPVIYSRASLAVSEPLPALVEASVSRAHSSAERSVQELWELSSLPSRSSRISVSVAVADDEAGSSNCAGGGLGAPAIGGGCSSGNLAGKSREPQISGAICSAPEVSRQDTASTASLPRQQSLSAEDARAAAPQLEYLRQLLASRGSVE